MKETSTGLSRTRGLMLTPEYAAPEQWKGISPEELDGRVDLYALGGVLNEMLTGHTSFHFHNTEGWMYQHLQAEPVPPSRLRPELAQWKGLDALVMRLLAKDRNGRPANADEFVRELEVVRRQQTIGAIREQRVKTVIEVRPGAAEKEPTTVRPNRETMVSGSKPTPASEPKKSGKVFGHISPWIWAAVAAVVLLSAGYFLASLVGKPKPATTSASQISSSVLSQPAQKDAGPANKSGRSNQKSRLTTEVPGNGSKPVGNRPAVPTNPEPSVQPERTPSVKPSPGTESGSARRDVPGTFVDHATRLMWTSKDNGRTLSWEEAGEYCRSLGLGGYDDWRLPKVEELRGLFDRSGSKLPECNAFPVRIRKEIDLTCYSVWSSTQGPGIRIPGGVIPNKLTFNFFNGAPYPDFYNDGSQHNKHDNQDRALCVRSTQN